MQASLATAEEMLSRAVEVARSGPNAHLSVLDELPAAIYVTDAEGLVTYYNPACVDFAGRVPTIGEDRWCVSWKLFTEDGAALPHDQCPMAVAIRTKRPVRGVTAVAERPDGRRIAFRPYPTPLLSEDGALLGAVNMFIEMTDSKAAESLRAQAERCRRLARSINDRRTVETLTLMAAEYEEKASGMDKGPSTRRLDG